MAYKYYAVHHGHVPGVYRKYEDCRQQIYGFSKAVFKGFDDYASAVTFWRTGRAPESNSSGQVDPSNTVTIRQAGREAELPLEGAVEEALRQLGLIPLPK